MGKSRFKLRVQGQDHCAGGLLCAHAPNKLPQPAERTYVERAEELLEFIDDDDEPARPADRKLPQPGKKLYEAVGVTVRSPPPEETSRAISGDLQDSRMLQHRRGVRPGHPLNTQLGDRLIGLADYLESNQPLAITRHGETLGFYIPAQKRSRKAQLEAMHAAARELDEMIASWGATEDGLMDEYKRIRQTARETKRNAK